MRASPYRSLLAIASVRRILVAAVISRLATSTLGLALLLAVHDRTGSYAIAGLAVTGRAIALAVASPAAGRFADRAGPRRALLTMLIGHAVAYGGLIVALAVGLPDAITIAAAVAVGLSTPPNTPVLRSLWPRMVPAEHLPGAYAIDGVSNEVTFVAGPLVVAALLGLVSEHWIVVVAGAAVIGGTLLLRREVLDVPVVSRSHADAPRSRLGAIGERRALAILTCSFWGAFAYGNAEVVAAFVADRDAAERAAGLALSSLAIGSVIGGLFAGQRLAANSRSLGRLYFAGAVTAAVVVWVDGAVWLTVAYLTVGLAAGPRDVIEQTLAGDACHEGRAVEMFAWFNTFTWLGYAVGVSAAGTWASLTGSSPAVLAVGACLLAVIVARWTGAPDDG